MPEYEMKQEVCVGNTWVYFYKRIQTPQEEEKQQRELEKALRNYGRAMVRAGIPLETVHFDANELPF